MSTSLHRMHIRGGPILPSSFGAVDQLLHMHCQDMLLGSQVHLQAFCIQDEHPFAQNACQGRSLLDIISRSCHPISANASPTCASVDFQALNAALDTMGGTAPPVMMYRIAAHDTGQFGTMMESGSWAV